MPTGSPILVLCTAPVDGNWRRVNGWSFPPCGRLATIGQRRIRGLPWGVGDPAAAFLDSPQWAIVRLDDDETPEALPAPPGAVHAIAALEFLEGRVIYSGDPRGAIETLIQHGADRAAMSVQLALPDIWGIADVGSFGVAVTGDNGMARGGAHSHVLVPGGYNGIAVAGRGGRATVGGSNGIAIVGADGHAIAPGVVVARESGGWLLAREAGVADAGVAVALASACELEVEGSGIAVGLDRVQRIAIGRHAVAVIRDATGSRIRVTLGEGALAIVRYFDSAGETPRFSLGQAGPDGLQPDVPYIWADGTFHLKSEYVAPEGEAASVPAKQDGAAPSAATAPPGNILFSETDDIVMATGDGWAISEGGGVAVAGPGGLARSAEAAQAGDGGIAITEGGKARAGTRGIAICDDYRYGTADAGDGGVAVGLGSRYGKISAGSGGAAIFVGWFGIVTAGDDGIAIGGFESKVRVGANGIAVASCKCPLGGPGSLLVCRGSDGDFRSAVVAPDGAIEPEFLLWAKQFERRPEND